MLLTTAVHHRWGLAGEERGAIRGTVGALALRNRTDNGKQKGSELVLH